MTLTILLLHVIFFLSTWGHCCYLPCYRCRLPAGCWRAVPWSVSVRQGPGSVPQGSALSPMAVAAVRCVRRSSTRIAMRGGPATTTKAWSVTMATMWAVPMASAGQRQKDAPANTMDRFIKMGRISTLDANTSAPASTERWGVFPSVQAMCPWRPLPVLPRS